MATISIADNDARVQHSIGGGGNTADSTQFTIDFPFFALDDINVIITNSSGVDTTLTRGSGAGTFAVTGTAVDDGFSGGYLTLGSAYTSSTVTIFRDIPVSRTTDFATSGPFNIAALNTELDRVIAIEQELETSLTRTMKLPDSDATASLVLPNVDTRKGKTLAFNATSGAAEAGPSVGAITTVSDISADIAALADIEDGTTATDAISGVAAIASNVTTVAGVASNVTTVAGQTTNLANVTNNLSAIQNADTNATTATTQAGIATAKAVLTAADVVSTNADVVTTNADAATTTADRVQVNTDKGVVAADKATVAADKATVATDKAAAASSASSASTSSSTATTKAAEASTSASNASTSETNSASSATASASSAAAAASSQTAAASSAASAASSFDSFDDRYHGSLSSNPSTDPDGNALASGMLYFNNTANEMRVYDGANWIAATSAGNVSLILYEYTATSGQTTFSGSDSNSATLSYTADNLQVVMNGIVLDPSDFTATNGTSVVLAAGAAANDLVNIYAFKSFTTADMVSKTSGGTFAGAVGFSGGITGDVAFDTSTLKVDSSNNRVGIGNAAPASLLHLDQGSGGEGLRFERDSYDTMDMELSESGFRIRNQTDGRTDLFIDGSGNVGIGLTPSQKLDVSGAAQISFVSGVNTYQYFQSTSNFVGRDTSGDLNVGVAGGQSIKFSEAGAERVKFVAGGNVDISAGHILLDNGYGINFAATSDASGMTSEILDDYEKGTWTASVVGSGGGTAQTMSGYYTKIGNIVHVHASAVSGINMSSSSGVLVINGLPFTAKSGAYQLLQLIHNNAGTYPSSRTQLEAYVSGNTQIVAITSGSGQGWNDFNVGSNTSAGIIVSGTYEVA